MDDPVKALGAIASDALLGIVRELLARRAGGHLVEARLDKIELRLAVELRATRDGAVEDLIAAVDRVLDEAIRDAAAFRPGRVFCHRCGGAECEHSKPPSCREVFTGYSPTGTPQWQDFAQWCLEHKHPEVDRLYDAPPAFLTVLEGGEGLQARLLQAFQSSTYEIKGQLTCGFFPLPARTGEGRGVLALTFQVVGPARARGGRCALNILGVAPGGEDLETLWERYREVPWRRTVRWGQSAVASVRPVDRRRPGSAHETDERIASILRGMARRLERDARARGRRTRHAELRHESGERPTRKALDDARGAGPGAVLVDDRSGARVVLGDRGRTHFFTVEGRLVSSVRYSKDAIERKRKLGLWREASPDEAGNLRNLILTDR